jgi:hypothetical protein
MTNYVIPDLPFPFCGTFASALVLGHATGANGNPYPKWFPDSNSATIRADDLRAVPSAQRRVHRFRRIAPY